MRYSEPEVERIMHVAFRTARMRKRQVCSVDKANVLETMQLWRDVATRVGERYPDVELTHMFVDAAAMQLMRAPKQFDVMVTGNVFGDILSDAAAMLTGRSACCRRRRWRTIARDCTSRCTARRPTSPGKDIANPLAAILSAAMMLRYSFERGDLRDEDRGRGARGARRGPSHRRHRTAAERRASARRRWATPSSKRFPGSRMTRRMS